MLEAAKQLGYVPNPVASALRAGRTSVVLLALPGVAARPTASPSA